MSMEAHLLDPKVRELYEATGHLGPWSHQEYTAVFPDLPPSKDPVSRAEERAARKFDKGLAEATQIEARAAAAYNDAEQAWFAAIRRVQRAEANISGPMTVTTDGQIVPLSGESRREIDEARAAESDLRTAFGDAALVLERARVALNMIEGRIDYARHAAHNA